MRVFVTGTAGFIGFHLARTLLEEGAIVHGYDGITDYYDVSLKRDRHAILADYPGFTATEAALEDAGALQAAVAQAAPDVVVHLAAQAGVRYSIDNPRAYVETNIVGTFNLMEAALAARPRHLMMASTSSVYGANTDMPYGEAMQADTQMSFYAATKKANESMAHAWAHINALPITMFRFFTVYGPWGRPDMALFKFTDAILNGRPIDVYNHGQMWRDFTYIDDLVRAIRLLMDTAPSAPGDRAPEEGGGAGLQPTGDFDAPIVHPTQPAIPGDSLSPVAPWRVVNIGNSESVRLEDFITAIEAATGLTATRNHMDMQPGDVPRTWADATLLRHLTGYAPRTDLRDGVASFVEWYRGYHDS